MCSVRFPKPDYSPKKMPKRLSHHHRAIRRIVSPLSFQANNG